MTKEEKSSLHETPIYVPLLKDDLDYINSACKLAEKDEKLCSALQQNSLSALIKIGMCETRQIDDYKSEIDDVGSLLFHPEENSTQFPPAHIEGPDITGISHASAILERPPAAVIGHLIHSTLAQVRQLHALLTPQQVADDIRSGFNYYVVVKRVVSPPPANPYR